MYEIYKMDIHLWNYNKLSQLLRREAYVLCIWNQKIWVFYTKK